MQKKYTSKRLSSVVLLVLAVGLYCFLSAPVMAQSEGEEKKEPERIRMSREAQKALYNAQEAMKIDKCVAAKNFLVDYRAAAPEDEVIPDIYYHMLGNAWMCMENLEEARKNYREGMDAFPDDENLFLNYAITTFQLELYAEAAPLFEKIYDTRKEKDSRFLFNAAIAYYQIENLAEAKRVLERMFSLPEKAQPEWYQMIIAICMEREETQEAERYILLYLADDPMKADYWMIYAQLRLDKEDYKGGASAWEISHQVKNPQNISRWKELAELYNYLNAPLKAAKSLEKAIEGDRSVENRLKLVELYKDALRFDKAITNLDNMIAEKPTARLYFEKGRLLYDLRRMKDAMAALDECIKLDPKLGDAYVLKGSAAWYLKDWKTARKVFKAAKSIRSVRMLADDALAALDDLESAKYKE